MHWSCAAWASRQSFDESGDQDDDLRRRLETARAGGDKRYHAKLKEQNKMFVRERLDRIMDPGWSFEDGLLARHVDGNLPADGVVTGRGRPRLAVGR